MPRKKERSDFKPRTLIAKTPNQRLYIRNVLGHPVNFVIGPAGTGKTHVAVGLAMRMLKNDQIDRIVISRPLVGVGKDMGYLPGDIGEKVGPYIQPCFDELSYYVGFAEIQQMLRNKIIEVVPLSMMRGRTFNNAFIILDEAQNTTRVELKTILTRIGIETTMVIAGDPAQVDLHEPGAFLESIDRLRHLDGVSVSSLGYNDIVRHSIVSDILENLW